MLEAIIHKSFATWALARTDVTGNSGTRMRTCVDDRHTCLNSDMKPCRRPNFFFNPGFFPSLCLFAKHSPVRTHPYGQFIPYRGHPRWMNAGIDDVTRCVHIEAYRKEDAFACHMPLSAPLRVPICTASLATDRNLRLRPDCRLI